MTQTTTKPDAPALTPREFARWGWRQLTSMRTALFLLLLLALGAVPGSVIPQQDINPVGVSKFHDDHKTLAPAYDKLGMFHVYSSVWFSAIYILLMISLVGCIIPRLRVYAKAMLAKPPALPRNLERLGAYASFETDASPSAVGAHAERRLSKRRYRTVLGAEELTSDSVSAERGYLREAGNLLFHVSVVVVLIAFAAGQLYGYKGGRIVVVGDGFSNSVEQYDEFSPGSLVDTGNLAWLNLTVDDFEVDYLKSGPEVGQPTDFHAAVSYTDKEGGPTKKVDLTVNHPLSLHGVSVFLVGNGYAPVFTVRDGNGDVVSDGPVIFLPEDSSYQSVGVVKVPEARPTQLGFEGWFYPTYQFTDQTGPFSAFPDALSPKVSLLAYAGDLGMDAGKAQNVFLLDKDNLEQVMKPGKEGSKEPGDAFRVDLGVGETVDLPNGLGSIELTGWQRWVKLQISDSPGDVYALAGVAAGTIGLLGSLFVRPRRVWVRTRRTASGRTLVEVGGLDRTGNVDDARAEVETLARELEEMT